MARLPTPVKVKICGNTRLQDALLAVELGADALGFIFYAKSPRAVTEKTVRSIVAKLPPFVQTVGVFVNERAEQVNRIVESCRLDFVQLHGEEPPAYCKGIRRRVLKAFRVRDASSLKPMPKYPVAGYLLDAFTPDRHGGTGMICDWDLVKRAGKFGPVILAGGLHPGNVAQAIRRACPYGVDVCSGVERAPGIKDPARLAAFIRAAKHIK